MSAGRARPVGGTAGLAIVSRSIWDGRSAGPGALVLRDGRVERRIRGEVDIARLRRTGLQVVDAGAGLVTPGLRDSHTFMTSALLEHGGVDAAGADDETVHARVAELAARAPGAVHLVRGVEGARERGEQLATAIDAAHPAAKVAVLASGRRWLVLTPGAVAAIGACDASSNEALAPLYAALGRDQALVRHAFCSVADSFAALGVTAVKDIGFDDYSGMLPALDALVRDDALSVDLSFSLQPVERPADLAFAERRRDRADAARFHGFKLMTDGAFDEGSASLLGAGDAPLGEGEDGVDWPLVESEARGILEAGHRLVLNADGDAAVRRSIGILERLADEHPLPPGTGLSDVSLVHPDDLPRMAARALIVETYPHLVRQEGLDRATLERLLGDRGSRFGPLARMREAGIRIVAGTDYPLFQPSLPEAMLSASERLLRGGAAGALDRWHPEHALTRTAVLEAWTSTPGSLVSGRPGTGTFDEGAPADVAVFDQDLLSATPDELERASAVLTIRGGSVTHAA